MDISQETIQDHIPYYLTIPQREGLIKALSEFPDNFNYYMDGRDNDLLQGDGWSGFQLFKFPSGECANVFGVVLSNSCDVSSENKRALPVSIVFAPVLRLEDYRALLERAGVSVQAIRAKIESIRLQRVTEIFYLPAKGEEGECIVLFSDLHSMPYSAFESLEEKGKRFTLSMCGFYLFLLKLSIHFCRFHENVERA